MTLAQARRPRVVPLSDDPQWYKDAIIYELRVRSFMDSNDDGVGDFRGLAGKLDYLQDLGVDTLWLLPFYPSPMKDDGYDISDYFDVHPEVGNLDDFRFFLEEAHRRGLRVVTELVINHTSDAHPWFQRARRAPAGSSHRDFYVWSDTPDRYREARIIFKDFEHSNWAWDPVAKAYYWHRFYSHQPDLNFDNPDVQQAVFGVMDFWLGLGVDGLRLDAVPYLYEREGTNCENLPETHAFLKRLRRHVEEKFQNRMLLAEANQWPEDAAAYFGDGDECHMNFHFPIMPRLFMGIHQEDRFPIIDILAQTPMVAESAQWALFLRNHDELTLEMVTDEERDYMYRAYAHDPTMRINLGIRRRLAPLVGNDRRNIELMKGLLFSLPGTPVLYYGDEIGMGDNVFLGDRNGVRTPMQWSSDRNAGFSRANPQRLILPVIIDPEYHYESLNVEAQQNNANSLLWWTKRMIALRRRFQAFGRGSIQFLSPDNSKVLAFVRRYKDETLLVVANLSRFPQYVELDLHELKGMIPVELFGRTEFPPIGELPYLLTIGGHAFYWFSLVRPRDARQEARRAGYQPPLLAVAAPWDNLVVGEERVLLEEALPAYLEARAWFEGQGRTIAAARILEAFPLEAGNVAIRAVLLAVDFTEGDTDVYLLPLGFAPEEQAGEIRLRYPQSVVAAVRLEGEDGTIPGILFEALADPSSCRPLLAGVLEPVSLRGVTGELVGSRWTAPDEGPPPDTRIVKAERGNAALAFGEKYFLKLKRKLDEGISPEVEIGRYLAEHGGSTAAPVALGTLEYRRRRGEPITLAILEPWIPNTGDARAYTREELGRFFERVVTEAGRAPPPPLPDRSPVRLALLEPPQVVADRIGAYLETVRAIGARLAQVHRSLAGGADEPAFAPEPYSALDQRSTYQTMRNLTGRVIRKLRHCAPRLPQPAADLAQQICDQEGPLYERFAPLRERRLTALRARCHGNLTLAKILHAGKAWVLVDFEGDRGRDFAERRRKRSPLRDVAGVLYSLRDTAMTVFRDSAIVREGDRRDAYPWSHAWQAWTGAAFLRAYLDPSGTLGFVPRDYQELELMLDCFVLEKALWMLSSALDGTPDQYDAALRVLKVLLEEPPHRAAPLP